MIFINKRKIGISIFLSIITLGIYQIYWMYLLVKNIRAVQKDDSGCVGEMLCLLLVPFYSYYWWFTRGKTVREEFTDHGYSVSGNETAYLILAIFGLDIVSMAIMQNDFNSYPTGSSRSVYNHDLPFVEEEDDIIILKHLTKHFPIKTNLFGKVLVSVKAVNDVSIKVKKGTTLGVVGESGCGKTTMGRTMLRLYDITSGEIIYKGLDLSRLTNSELRSILPPDSAYDTVRSKGNREELLEVLGEIGVNINSVPRSALRKLRPDLQIIFQDPYSSLSPRLTIGSIISEAVEEHHIVPKSEVREYVLKIMKECGLQPYYYDRYPHEFSGGQRQRICIARALALNPKVVVCDEPVSALDVSIQAQIINLLKDLQEQRGITYVFISHDLSVVKHISNEVAVMYLGSLMEKAPTGAIFDTPLHPYTKALLSAVPVPDPNVKMNRIILEGDIPSPANPPAGCKFHTRCRECMEVCKSVEPKLVEYAPDHFVACHLYQKETNDAEEAKTEA